MAERNPLERWTHDLRVLVAETETRAAHAFGVGRSTTPQPVPAPRGAFPYRLDLLDLIPAETRSEVVNQEQLSFHIVGDTGGSEQQHVVAQCLEHDARNMPFLGAWFHLGDVVYSHGERKHYYEQFYEPYRSYPAPIVAVPGNHDASPVAPEQSLDAFVDNFCAPHPLFTPEAEGSRLAQIQPHVYFTLKTPVCWFIGLYTNVVEHGALDQNQLRWFEHELAAAPKELPLFVCSHHPPYTVDVVHGQSVYLQETLFTAFKRANRYPTAVFSGHAHCYQRFAILHPDGNDPRTIPFIVAGAGGHTPLEPAKTGSGGVQPEKCEDAHHGFLRITVSRSEVLLVYRTVPNFWEELRPGGEDWDAREAFDTFTFPVGADVS